MMFEEPAVSGPRYLAVKEDILEKVRSGEWPEGSRIPSEVELTKTTGLARMTINRALRELAAEGVLLRMQGVGTFVAAPKARSDLLQVRDIAGEIAERGHKHTLSVVSLDTVRADFDLAQSFGTLPGASIFHSILVHNENGVPIQLEERYVNPAFAPAYIDQDFTNEEPAKYLLRLASPSQVEHSVYAIRPDAKSKKYLKIDSNEPCLLLVRRTWVDGAAATKSLFVYPGSRYGLTSRYVSETVASGSARQT